MRKCGRSETDLAGEGLDAVCGELPTPEAGYGEVRVRLEASGVNPSDTYRRRGPPAMEFPRVVSRRPLFLGEGKIPPAGQRKGAGFLDFLPVRSVIFPDDGFRRWKIER